MARTSSRDVQAFVEGTQYNVQELGRFDNEEVTARIELEPAPLLGSMASDQMNGGSPH